VDEQQRRIMARIVISDEGHMFHPGLFAEVSGEVPGGESLTISTGAVVPTGSKYIVVRRSRRRETRAAPD
jgi:molybdopterin biosynthesis enzyme